MSVTYDISWQGCLFDLDKQTELIEQVRKIGQIYNDIYFDGDKDETTLSFFDHTTLTGEIEISSSLLNIPENYTNNDIFPLVKHPKSNFSFICTEVRLFGVQFLIKGDPMYTRKDKSCLERVSYVFWGFNSTTEENYFVKSNLAKLHINRFSDKTTGYEIASPYVSSRLLKIWFVIYLYEFVKHYYIKDLEIDNTMFWDNDYQSNIKKYMIENDPNGSNPEIKEKAFEMILNEVEFYAQKTRKLDELDFEHDKNPASGNKDDFMI